MTVSSADFRRPSIARSESLDEKLCRCSILLSVVLAVLLATDASLLADANVNHPTLAIGSPAPDFCLPGVDGKNHCLTEYAGSRVLVIAFICNHCPTSQLYETRIKQLSQDRS